MQIVAYDGARTILEFTAILYMIILVAITSQIENVNKQGANSIKVFASQIGVNF